MLLLLTIHINSVQQHLILLTAGGNALLQAANGATKQHYSEHNIICGDSAL